MGAAIATNLLILQDRHMKLQQIEGDLARLPEEREATRGNIKAFEAQIEAGRQAVKQLEARGKLIDVEMGQAEALIVKYKSQQVMVKKNDEYQALTHEIENAEKKVSDLESQELEVLYELDNAREAQKKSEVGIRAEIEIENRVMTRHDEKEANLKSEIDAAREAFAEAESKTSRPELSKYRQVARGVKFPVVVALRSQNCSGCHMRVSNAIDHDVRKAEEIITCDTCGRILYIED